MSLPKKPKMARAPATVVSHTLMSRSNRGRSALRRRYVGSTVSIQPKRSSVRGSFRQQTPDTPTPPQAVQQL